MLNVPLKLSRIPSFEIRDLILKYIQKATRYLKKEMHKSAEKTARKFESIKFVRISGLKSDIFPSDLTLVFTFHSLLLRNFIMKIMGSKSLYNNFRMTNFRNFFGISVLKNPWVVTRKCQF